MRKVLAKCVTGVGVLLLAVASSHAFAQVAADIQQAAVDPGSGSSLGVFADDVCLGRSSGTFGAMKDLERIQVLRGPQGTLSGRITIGGVIHVITKAPSDEFSGSFEVGISNYGGYNLFGVVGGQIAGEKSMFRAAAWRKERDGWATGAPAGIAQAHQRRTIFTYGQYANR